MSDNITVAIKVRPLIKREQDERQQIQWVMGKNSITQLDPETNKRGESEFHFDYIFDMEKTNQDVFDSIAKPIVDAAMKGFNGTIFAYGQTGSGKTYTMMGTKSERGVIPLVVDYIFDYIQNDPDKEFLLRVSYIEIYNERINDLIDPSRTDLKIKEDVHGHISVDCKEEVGTTPQSVLQLMKKGDKNRRTGETNMNERSSRSHSIFRITIESCNKSDPDTSAKEAQLNLIDLAGSERARNTGATGERFNEGCNINKSLSTLALVIKQLSEAQTMGKFVNFRDSKLTRILQPSLGGNALTTVICAVTPAATDETQCTLNFALRAKGVKNKPTVNETVSQKALLKRVKAHTTELEASMKEMQTKLREKDRLILEFRIHFLNTQIISRNSHETEDTKSKARRRRTWAGNRLGGVSSFSSSVFDLPTIEEADTNKCESPMERFTQDQHNMLNELDLTNQSFGPAFADFELQLIQDQREKEEMNRFSSLSDDYPIPAGCVTVRNVRDGDENLFDQAGYSSVMTPTKDNCPSTSTSPDTPKTDLRDKVDELRSEYNDLRELTTLEKQLFQDDCTAGINHAKYEKNLAFITKSLGDSEQICRDLNKKYAELRSEHTILSAKHEASMQDCELLHQEVKSLTSLRDIVASVEAEKNEYKAKFNDALNKLKTLKDESSTHDFEMDMLKTKHKSREKELEASLNLAWQEFMDPSTKQKFTDIVHLQSVVVELNAKVASLEAQLTPTSTPDNEDLSAKLHEMDEALKRSEEEKSTLMNQVDELSRCLENLSKSEETVLNSQEIPSTNELDIHVEEYTKRIQELEQMIAEKDSELSKNLELTAKFLEATDKVKMNENLIDQMKNDIDRLQLNLQEKSTELLQMKSRFEELNHISENVDAALEDSKKTSQENESQVAVYQEELAAAVAVIKAKEFEISELKEVLKEKVGEFQKSSEVSEETKCQNEVLENELKSAIEHSHHHEVSPAPMEEANPEISRLEEIIKEKSAELTTSQGRISELQTTIEKLKDQIVSIQSDRTILDGEKLAMQSMLQEKDDELQKIPKLEIQLAFVKSEKEEFDKIAAELRKQLNEKQLELETKQGHENEIRNLNSYVASLQSFMKSIKDENEELKKELEKVTNSLKMLEDGKKSMLIDLESLKKSTQVVSPKASLQTESVQDTTVNDTKSSRVCQVVKPLNIAESEMMQKSSQSETNHNTPQDDKDTSSIFANGSYFDNMNVSATSDLNESVSLMQSLSGYQSDANNTTAVENKQQWEDSKNLLNVTTTELINHLHDKSSQDLIGIAQELYTRHTTLEDENTKLAEIVKEFKGLTLDMEKLQQTILVLTTENEDMAGKLAVEKDRTNDLEAKLKTLTDENQSHHLQIKMLQEELEKHQESTPATNNEEIEQQIEDYKSKIASLTAENEELSTNLMDKIEELDKIKLSKSLQFEHKCTHQEKLEYFIERISILDKENIALSENLIEKIEAMDNLREAYETLKDNVKPEVMKKAEEQLETSRSFDKSNREKLNASKLSLTDKSMHDEINRSHEEKVLFKISVLERQIEELKTLNAKLTDLKLPSCTQCAHIAELNSTRRALKNEIIIVDRRLAELQEKFKQECADVEILDNKAKRDTNVSLHDETFNGSMLEGVNVSFMEEKVQRLHTKLEQLSIQCQDKCNEVEKLKDSNILETSQVLASSSPRPSRRDAKIERIQKELNKHKDDVHQMMKTLNGVSHSLQKFKNQETSMQNEIETLRTAKELLEEKLRRTESLASNAQELKLTLEKEIDGLKSEKTDCEEKINELRQSLLNVKDSNTALQTELETLKTINQEQASLNDELIEHKQNVESLQAKVKDLTDSLHTSEEANNDLKSELEVLKSTPPPEREQVTELTANLEEYKQKMDTLQTSVKDLREKLNTYEKENVDFANQIAKLQSQSKSANVNESAMAMEVCDESFTQNSTDKSLEEISTIRECIMKEMLSLKPNAADLTKLSTPALFSTFLTAIVAKQNEIVETIIRRKINKLEEEKKQLVDREKRNNAWGKELEAEIEKLQNDLTKQEEKNTTLTSKIAELKSSLLDSEHEKQLMREKMTIMESDFNALQADLEKHCGSRKNESINASQERDKYIQDAIENRDAEHRAKLVQIEKNYKAKVEELSNALECSKTQNMELRSNLEGLEVNERQLQTIVDMKSNDFTKAESTIQHLQEQLKDLSEVYNQMNEENQVKSLKLEEITALLKIKCDKMSQYKTQLETITPEYEMLKVQVNDRQLRLEKYKSEVENLQDEKMKQMSSMKDKLDSEEIKSAGLTKQLSEMTNRYTVFQSELEKLREKCEQLESDNERLVRKVRNSTSKLTADRKIEDLTDENRTLQKNLDGASNRIAELQKYKSQLEKDHMELKGQFDLVCRENNELKITLTNYKSKMTSPDVLDLRNKYDCLLQEKNQIALELEAKRSLILQHEMKITSLMKDNDTLRKENKELDIEADDMVKKIHELDSDNTRLQVKIQDLEAEKTSQSSLKLSTSQNADVNTLKRDYEDIKRKLDTETMTTEMLRRENADFRSKIGDRNEGRSSSNSRNASPTPSNRSRQRRNDIFNENRLIEVGEEIAIIDNQCQCDNLRRTIMKLEQDLAVKDAKVGALEMQIESENFPLVKKCRDLEEVVMAYTKKNQSLKTEIQKLRNHRTDCERCMNWRANQREVSTQTDVKPEPAWMNGSGGSGVIKEIVDLKMEIQKLERGKKQYKEICIGRRTQIRELTEKLEKYENREEEYERQIKFLQNQSSVRATAPSNPDSNHKNVMKENVPTNLLGISTTTASHRNRLH